MVAQSVLLPEFKQVTGSNDRKLCAVAFTKMLTDAKKLSTPDYISLWYACVSCDNDDNTIRCSP